MKVLTRYPAEHPGLVIVDSRFRGSNIPAGAGFHFDKAESVVFPGHKVKIATNLRVTPSTRHNRVAAAAQVEVGCFFSAPPKFQMRRPPSP